MAILLKTGVFGAGVGAAVTPRAPPSIRGSRLGWVCFPVDGNLGCEGWEQNVGSAAAEFCLAAEILTSAKPFQRNVFIFMMFYRFAISMTRASEISEPSFVFLCVSSSFPRNGGAACSLEAPGSSPLLSQMGATASRGPLRSGASKSVSPRGLQGSRFLLPGC